MSELLKPELADHAVIFYHQIICVLSFAIGSTALLEFWLRHTTPPSPAPQDSPPPNLPHPDSQ